MPVAAQLALWEVLTYDWLLEDALVGQALAAALGAATEWDDSRFLRILESLPLASKRMWPGLYRLMAHDNMDVRMMVRQGPSHLNLVPCLKSQF